MAKTVAASLAILGASLAVAQPAMAVNWYSRSNPLHGYESDKTFGLVYGNFYNYNSTYANSTTYQYDSQADGHDVRAETDYYFWETGTGCDPGASCWRQDTSKQSAETSSAAWVKDNRSEPLHGGASGARGGVNLCEIIAWHNDPCSVHAWPSFSY